MCTVPSEYGICFLGLILIVPSSSYDRHLAHKWSNTIIPHNTKRRLMTSATEISTIEHLILLDLLGAPNPTIQPFFLDTNWLFNKMVSSEKRLGAAGAFRKTIGGVNVVDENWRSFFKVRPEGDNRNYGFIDDDHAPFMRAGVSVLHVISSPFPSVWHTLRVRSPRLARAVRSPLMFVSQDDASALDLETCRRWNLIMRVFVSEYLNLEPSSERKIGRSGQDLVRVCLPKIM